MEKFNPETQSDLYRNFKNKDKFIKVYNEIADRLTEYENEIKSRKDGEAYKDYDAGSRLEFIVSEYNIHVKVKDGKIPYQNSAILDMEIRKIIRDIIKPAISCD